MSDHCDLPLVRCPDGGLRCLASDCCSVPLDRHDLVVECTDVAGDHHHDPGEPFLVAA